MHLIDNTHIHLPDLAFVRICNEKYHVNRGVYNTIEDWFYRKGLINIVVRRRAILYFLELRKKEAAHDDKMKKFGPGGVSFQLSRFWQEYIDPVPDWHSEKIG